MARTFTKNTANYLGLGVGTLGPLLNGASKISFAAIIKPSSFDNIGATQNPILHLKINGASSGVFCCVDALTSSPNAKFKVGGRSVSTDAFQSVNGGTTISTGTEYCVGGMLDIGGDTITVYVNGAVDAGPTAVTFGNATWTYGTATGADMICANLSPPGDTANQFAGDVSEVAIWIGDIGAAGFAALNSRFNPSHVRPDLLACWWPLLGNYSPEIDLRNGKNGTITGTVAKADHPRMIYQRRRGAQRWASAAAATASYIQRQMLIGVGI